MNEVLDAQAAKFAAQVAADLVALDRLLADDLVYCHASGQRDDKAGFLAGPVRHGYHAIERTEAQVRRWGDLAVITGTADIRPTPDIRLLARFTDIWALRDGRWVNVSWQATPAQP